MRFELFTQDSSASGDDTGVLTRWGETLPVEETASGGLIIQGLGVALFAVFFVAVVLWAFRVRLLAALAFFTAILLTFFTLSTGLGLLDALVIGTVCFVLFRGIDDAIAFRRSLHRALPEHPGADRRGPARRAAAGRVARRRALRTVIVVAATFSLLIPNAFVWGISLPLLVPIALLLLGGLGVSLLFALVAMPRIAAAWSPEPESAQEKPEGAQEVQELVAGGETGEPGSERAASDVSGARTAEDAGDARPSEVGTGFEPGGVFFPGRAVDADSRVPQEVPQGPWGETPAGAEPAPADGPGFSGPADSSAPDAELARFADAGDPADEAFEGIASEGGDAADEEPYEAMSPQELAAAEEAMADAEVRAAKEASTAGSEGLSRSARRAARAARAAALRRAAEEAEAARKQDQQEPHAPTTAGVTGHDAGQGAVALNEGLKAERESQPSVTARLSEGTANAASEAERGQPSLETESSLETTDIQLPAARGQAVAADTAQSGDFGAPRPLPDFLGRLPEGVTPHTASIATVKRPVQPTGPDERVRRRSTPSDERLREDRTAFAPLGLRNEPAPGGSGVPEDASASGQVDMADSDRGRVFVAGVAEAAVETPDHSGQLPAGPVQADAAHDAPRADEDGAHDEPAADTAHGEPRIGGAHAGLRAEAEEGGRHNREARRESRAGAAHAGPRADAVDDAPPQEPGAHAEAQAQATQDEPWAGLGETLPGPPEERPAPEGIDLHTAALALGLPAGSAAEDVLAAAEAAERAEIEAAEDGLLPVAGPAGTGQLPIVIDAAAAVEAGYLSRRELRRRTVQRTDPVTASIPRRGRRVAGNDADAPVPE